WAGAAINASMPHWPIVAHLTISPWYSFQLDLFRVMWAILPAACLWGASFPLALAAAATPGVDPGRMIGAVYASNTVGAIIGALMFSIALVPVIGTFQAQRLLMGICLLAGILMLMSVVREPNGGSPPREQPLNAGAAMAWALTSVVAAFLLIWNAPPPAPGLLAFGRILPWIQQAMPDVLFTGEGINTTVAVT